MGPNKLLTTILLLVISGEIRSQVHTFGDIPREHLEMQIYENDPTASAVVLFAIGESDIDFRRGEFILKARVHERVKILTDEEQTFGNISILFWNNWSDFPQRIRNLKTASYSLDESGSFVTREIPREDYFEERVSSHISELGVSISNLKKGDIFEYSYEIYSETPWDLLDWFFQDTIPVMWSEYRIRIPDWLTLSSVTKGFHDYHINTQESYTDYVSFDDFVTLQVQGSEYRLVMKDLVAFEELPYMKTANDYLSQIRYQPVSIEFPDRFYEEFAYTWTELITEMLQDDHFGKRLNGKWVGKEVTEFVDNSDTDFDKLVEVYNHVSKAITWDGEYGLWSVKRPELVYEEGSGNGTSINLILVDFLRAAGLEAYPVIISTRLNGEIAREFPGFDQFNHTIAYVEVDGGYHLLDATNENLPYNLLSPEVLNGEGLLIHPNKELWIPLDNKMASNEVCSVNIQISERGIKGTLNLSSKGYFAYNRRIKVDTSALKRSIKEEILKTTDNYLIDSVRIAKDVLDGSFGVEVDFHIKENLDSEVLYFNPMVIGDWQNPFIKNERYFPVDYNFPFSENMVYSLTIPDGWIVDKLPEPITHRLPNNGGKFQRLIQVDGNTVIMNDILRIEKYRFMPGEYGELKSMYDRMMATIDASIIITRQRGD